MFVHQIIISLDTIHIVNYKCIIDNNKNKSIQ